MIDETDQSETLAFLAAPGALGMDGRAERIDTHGAILFLAGDRVYKLKRAVRLPYLDFSTIARRKAVCEAELRLNRRTAPDLYLDVRAVSRQVDGKIGFGPGTPVDWLVVMRRFAADDLLDTVAAQGPLKPTLVRTLADEIAAFHDRAEIVRIDDGAGRVRAVIDGNKASMAACDPALLTPADRDRLHAASIAALEPIAPLLDARGRSGHVRHAHGDLHLANICLWQGRPTLFDCLEFDARLATIDLLYDLAFLVMDLWQRGQHDAASLLFNRYLDMTGEQDGIAAVPLFLSMRAAIRAHVAAKTSENQADPDAAEAKRIQARAYLSAALGILDRPPPRLVAIGGLSGTGKSTLAGRIAPRIGGAPGARWLRSDVLRKRMAGVAPEQRLPSEAYAAGQSAAVYDRLAEASGACLAGRQSVIVDAVFARADERAAIAAVADRLGLPFHGLWLDAPQAVLASRVEARTGDASDADAAVVASQSRYAIGDLAGWQRIDASGTAEESFARATDALAQAGAI